MSDYDERVIDLSPGLAMRGRHYQGGDKTPVLCLHGLTRNAADFADFAPRVAATGRDVLAISFRGRGASDRDPNYKNYHPFVYQDDVLKALDNMNWREAVFVGTSLGGIVTMLTNAKAPERVKAAVLNDVGPELAPEGIARIAGYVGQNLEPAKSLVDAANKIKAINGVAFPDASEDDWMIFAERTFRKLEDGRWAYDYDQKIATAMAELGPAPDLWPGMESLKNKPVLVVRGALSDLLSRDIVGQMLSVCPNLKYVEVPRVGHAPMLTEPAAFDAIEKFLGDID